MSKELTALEQSKEIIRKHCEKQPKPCYLMLNLEIPFSEIEKALKALEIIKNKRVNVDTFFIRRHILTNNNPKDFTEKEYCNDYNFFLHRQVGTKLSQEEYDLLREVLL